MKAYLVGGAVRDIVMGRKPKDRDFVVIGETPETMLAQGFRRVGNDFPVFLHPRTGEEYALARTERATGRAHIDFACETDGVTLEEDLRRRDLTINAMAMDESGNIIDPFNGKCDIELRLLKHVSDAFADDPLRVLRAARFAAQLSKREKPFRIHPDTRDVMMTIVASGALNTLTPERISLELEKALSASQAQRFFSELVEYDALAAIMPEIASIIVEGEERYVSNRPMFADMQHGLASNEVGPLVAFGIVAAAIDDVKRVEALCNRLRLSNDLRRVGLDAATWSKLAQRTSNADATKLVDAFEQLKAQQSVSRALDVAAVAGMQAIGGPEKFRRLALAFHGFNTSRVAELAIATGAKGKEIASAIRLARIDDFKKLLNR